MSYITVGAAVRERPGKRVRERPGKRVRERPGKPAKPMPRPLWMAPRPRPKPVRTKIIMHPKPVRRPDGKIVTVMTPVAVPADTPTVTTMTAAGPVLTAVGPVPMGPAPAVGPGYQPPPEVEAAAEAAEEAAEEAAPKEPEAETPKGGIPGWAWLLGGGAVLWWILK